jgi:hypothetical protein
MAAMKFRQSGVPQVRRHQRLAEVLLQAKRHQRSSVEVGDLRDGGNVQHEPMEVVDFFLCVPMEPALAEFLSELRSLGGVIRIIVVSHFLY